MKRILPAILAGLVLAVGISFLVAQDDAAPVAKSASNATSDDALPAAEEKSDKPGQPAASNDAAAPAVEKSDKPAPSVYLEDNLQKFPAGPEFRKSWRFGVQIVPVRHHDAASLADVLKKIWPTKADEIY